MFVCQVLTCINKGIILELLHFVCVFGKAVKLGVVQLLHEVLTVLRVTLEDVIVFCQLLHCCGIGIHFHGGKLVRNDSVVYAGLFFKKSCLFDIVG